MSSPHAQQLSFTLTPCKSMEGGLWLQGDFDSFYTGVGSQQPGPMSIPRDGKGVTDARFSVFNALMKSVHYLIDLETVLM